MPYPNVPQSQWGKMDRCVDQVTGQGHSKEDAIAICFSSIVEARALPEGIVVSYEGLEESDSSTVTLPVPTNYSLIERGARHTREEYDLIRQILKYAIRLYGPIENLDEIMQESAVRESYPDLPQPMMIDYLTAIIHETFTVEADEMVKQGWLNQPDRICLSGAIGCALDAFNAHISGSAPHLIQRPLGFIMESSMPPASSSRSRPLRESSPWTGTVSGNKLKGVVVVEGRSLNGNVYTREALQSGIDVFAGQPIYADHPSKLDESDRPERSIRDLVGRIDHTWVEAMPGTDRYALMFEGVISSAEETLLTKLREGILGDMSINAVGEGAETGEGFVVSRFTNATSLDFVTKAAAGGAGMLVESAPAEVPPTRLKETHMLTPREKALGLGFRLLRRQVRVQARQESLKTMLDKSGLPAASIKRVAESLAPLVRRVSEQEPVPFPAASGLAAGDPPTIELPPDAAELPPDAQKAFLNAYVDAYPQGADQAIYIAWAAVYSAGWTKNESGEWTQSGGDVPSEPEMLPPEGMTSPQFAEAVTKAIGQEKAYIDELRKSESVSGIQPGSHTDLKEADPSKTSANLAEAFAGLLPEKQAKIAAAGR